MHSISRGNERIYRWLKRAVYPPNQTAYLPFEPEACPDKVVRGPLPDVPQPESATVSPSNGGRLVRAGLRDVSAVGRSEMHPEDLMKPDLFSEILLLGSGGLIFIPLLLIVVMAFARA